MDEFYDTELIVGDDLELIGTEITVNCTLYLGEICLFFLVCFVAAGSVVSLLQRPSYRPPASRLALLQAMLCEFGVVCSSCVPALSRSLCYTLCFSAQYNPWIYVVKFFAQATMPLTEACFSPLPVLV